MQPISQRPTIESFEQSLLEKVPIEIKLMVLKCLNIPILANTSILNKFWQKLGLDNRVWKQVALGLNIKGDLKDAKQEIMDHLKFHAAVEVVEEFLKGPKVNSSEEENKAIKHLENKNVKEKYQIFLQWFTPGKSNFFDFMQVILRINPLLPKHIQGLKQLIEGGAIIEERLEARNLVVPDDQIEIFQYLVNKFKHRKEILAEAAGIFALSHHNKEAFLKILCIAGVRPEAFHLINAASERYANEHLQVLLDYSDESVRKEAILKLGENKTAMEIIQKAPKPTYGKVR